ncbi:Guanine nucleotide-binding protein G(I)/G(S)/G(O) subunit gamma-2 [Aix galericulata]|nr:Guanine nucleotide-binding protein G(I)/G(S)/G(O) subunit gamma-2 [Aix galericulata]
MASNNTASIAQARKLVEQLKMEANIDRIKEAPRHAKIPRGTPPGRCKPKAGAAVLGRDVPKGNRAVPGVGWPQAARPQLLFFQVSKAAADLMAYCEAHAKEDPLLTPVPASENPFREKKFFCVIL